MSNFPPRTPEWFAERAALMRAAKAAKRQRVQAAQTPPAKRRGWGTQPGDKKIRWTSQEVEAVAAACAPLLLKQGIHFLPSNDDRTGSGFLLDATFTAQNVLPPERRKPNSPQRSRARLPDQYWRALKRELKAAPSTPPAQANGTNGQHIAEQVAPTPKPAAPEYKYQEEVIAREVITLDSLSTAQLAVELVGRLFRMLEQKSSPAKLEEIERTLEERRKFDELLTDELSDLRKQVEALTPQLKLPLGETVTPFPEPERPRLPRVAILGCHKDQFDVIKSESEKLGLDLDLRYYDQDQKPVPVYCDYAISMRWVRHHWDDQVKKTVPRGKTMFISGGVMSVVKQLQTWFGQQTASA